MKKENRDNLFFEVLVIGTGVAGLSFALKIADFTKVLMITKLASNESNTNYAQGGLASVFSPNDSFKNHIEDTIICGDGLCDEKVVDKILRMVPKCIQKLVEIGANFNKTPSGTFDLGIEGGHSRRRIIHSDDLTGREVERVLLEAVLKHPKITILENHIAVNLVVKENRCVGCYVLDSSKQEIRNFAAKITVLATGGIGQVFAHTTNPSVATGDGIAMAYRVGAEIMNMEFTQFHPTTLYHPLADSFLISESLRGEGAILLDKKGNRFMRNYHPLMGLAPRDIVARAIDDNLKKSGENYVFLDISMKDPEFIKKRFPEIYNKCLFYGIDITKERIPVIPAAHYCCGGVKAKIFGETNIQGLFAIGETACTGLHGANRLASNSIVEGLVCAYFTGERCIEILEKDIPSLHFQPWESGDAVDSDEMVVLSHTKDEISRLMWNYVGIVRSDKRLKRAKARISLIRQEIDDYYWNFIVTPDLVETRNMALVAELIIDSALIRKETRGIHYSLDYPNKNPIPKNTVLRRLIEK